MIYATTKRAINSSMLPADAGCIVDNVETLIAIYEAVISGKPLYERVVTVSGDAVKEPGNFLAPCGMSQMELIEMAGGFEGVPEKVISGGPMMGFAMFSTEVPVTKTSSAILGFSKDEVKSMSQVRVSTADAVWMPVQAGLFRRDWQILLNGMTKSRS